jgi:protein-export membrane protein SecD/preprotein translocase SecF subunit
MLENARRTFLLIAALVIGSVLLLVLPDRPIRLGLDLAGGVRLVYRLDFEQAYRDGALDRAQPKDQVIEETISIIRSRIDPEGVRNPTIRKLGEDRIEIALPRSVQVTGVQARSTTVKELAGDAAAPNVMADIELLPESADLNAKFPGAGGVVEIGREKIRYSARVGNNLVVEHRGEAGTSLAAHPAGSTVVLVSDDQIERLITELGDMRFYIGATEATFQAMGKDFTAARQRVVDWLKKPENAQVPISRYNALPEEQGGPPVGIRWFPHRQDEGAAPLPREERGLQALQVPKEEWTFTGSSLASVTKSQDRMGFPAVSFQTKPEFIAPFGDFTGAHVDESMAIVLNDEVVSFANIGEKLPGQAQIYGRFTDQQVDSMVSVLRSGSLQIKPVLQQREDVGATLGLESLEQGWIMCALALALVAAFMCAYYRMLGVYSSIALAINLLMQMGGLVAFQAILTMPGIAGIILGIGMAVDANILIFARIREEQEAGKKPMQAAKAGFGHALSAIVDSNVTTVISGAILYFVGTGPIRGFAVTLIIGVLTSMFAALVVVRLLVHWHLERWPNQPFKMGALLANANYSILSKSRAAVGVGLVLVIGGFALFGILDDKKKLGIDFLGGATVRVRTAKPESASDLRAKVQGLGGEFSSAEVVGLPASRVGEDAFTQFRITFKTEYKVEAADSDKAGTEQIFKDIVRNGLGDVLQPDRLQVSQVQSTDASTVSGTLYFEAAHPTADIAARLEAAAQLKDVKVEPLSADRPDTVKFTGTARAGILDDSLPTLVAGAFVGESDTTGKVMKLTEQIPESSVIGRQVVRELRDSAIRALLLSLFMTVIYIRVRFSEYSYGLAAVAALFFDISFTVGAISLLIAIPSVHIEFDMGTIAVFLTIVGYSINDKIVVFDRIRENLPRRKGTLEEIVNLSINETLSRTVITSLAVATIFIVLIFNLGTGNVLEGFSYAMMFGIIGGTFSSIYIAAPVFIWLEKRQMRKDEEARKAEEQLGRAGGASKPAAS